MPKMKLNLIGSWLKETQSTDWQDSQDLCQSQSTAEERYNTPFLLNVWRQYS